MGGLEAQAAARAQLQEVEPAIRYCSYRLGGSDGAGAADLAADLPSTPTSDLLGVLTYTIVIAQSCSATCGVLALGRAEAPPALQQVAAWPTLT